MQINSADQNYFGFAAGLAAIFKRGESAFFNCETILGYSHLVDHSSTGVVRFEC